MTNEQIKELLASMSLEEKLGEMTQLVPYFFGEDDSVELTGPMQSIGLTPEQIGVVGSTLNAMGAENIIQMQKNHMEKQPHHIPMLFMADVIHGLKTIYPIPLAMGCSFSPELMEEAAAMAAREAAATGIHLTFSPMADLVRDPRWGRVMESPGEDPLLNARMTAANVRGYRGEDSAAPDRIAACFKHFGGYGASEAGRDYNTVDISDGMLREFYLSGYKAAVDAGAEMGMTSFNTIDRVPATGNTKLYRKILRDEWGFEGVTITDYCALAEMINHGFAADGREAAKYGLIAGSDIEMMSTHYMKNGKDLVETGEVDMALIDEAVLRILTLKNKLGLFENPFKGADAAKEKELCLCEAHREIARRVAARCIVLLKNEGNVLPLPPIQAESGDTGRAGQTNSAGAEQQDSANAGYVGQTNSAGAGQQASQGSVKLGLAGPFADSKQVLGGWAIMQTAGDDTFLDALRKQGYAPVTAMTEELRPMQEGFMDVTDQTAELEGLKDCDIVIAAVGEHPDDTGESASKTILRLSHNQEKMLEKLHDMGKKVVAVIFSGRPLEIRPVLPYCDAVVQTWFLGTEAAGAIVDVLTGKVNPSARLSMSFPQTVGQIPVYYNHMRTGRPMLGKYSRFISGYLDCPNEPLFAFGYGLSYSEYRYGKLEIRVEGALDESQKNEINKGKAVISADKSQRDRIKKNECRGKDAIFATVSVEVENVSDVPGRETVQLYIRDIAASCVRPVKELKDFVQIDLAPHEKRQVNFAVTKDMLSFWNNEKFVFEHGEFEIMVGHSSMDEEELREKITL